ncbi:pntB [Symbiodinium sp. KB8]|nr:pntB [Symbiodinium sp. KB8]
MPCFQNFSCPQNAGEVQLAGWAERSGEKRLRLGSQVAAASALAAALQRQKAQKLVLRSAAACQRLAKHLMASSLTSDLLKPLWKACLEAAASPVGSSSRRKSGKSSLNGAGSAEAATLLLEVALMRPKAFAAPRAICMQASPAASGFVSLNSVPKSSLLGKEALFDYQPGLATGPPGIRANALLLLRSLLVNGWDQMMLVLILSRLSSTEEKQVRAASVAVLESLQAASLQDDSVDTLVEAKLLLPTASVAPEKVLRILNVPITDTSLRPFAAPLLRACATDAVCADLQPNAVNPLPPTFWNARGFDLQYKLQSSWKTMAHESRSLKCELKEFWQGTDYGTHIEEEGVCNLTCAPYEGPDRAKLYVEIALETAGVVPAIVIQGILPRSLRLFLEVFVAFWLMYFTQQFRHSHRHVPALPRIKAMLSCGKVCSSMGQLPQELWSSLLELLLQQKAELLQDPVAAHNVLQKVLGLKGGLPKASREQGRPPGLENRGLGEDPELAEGLTTALPGALSLHSTFTTAGFHVHLVAYGGRRVAKPGALMSAADKIRTAAQDAAVEAMRQVVLPFASGLTQLCEKAKEAPSWDAQQVRIAGLTCPVLSKVALAFASHGVQEELVTEALKALFRPTSESFQHNGLSPSGQETKYRISRQKDLEDDDRSARVEIGSLVLNHEDERGRDFAQEVFTVSYKGKVICQSSDARARASRFDKPMAVREGSAEAVLEVLKEVAASEQLSVQDFVNALPRDFSWAPMQPGRLLLLLEGQGSEFRGSALKAARVEVAAEILCEQVAGLEATASGEDSAKLLRKLAEVIKEAKRRPQEQLRVTLRREQGLEVRSCVSFGQMTLSATAMSDAVNLPSFRETYLYSYKRNVRSSDVLADSGFRDEEEDLDLSQIRVLNAWASTAMKSLAGLAGGLPLVQAMQALGSGGGTALDMLGGVGSIDAFLEESEKSLATHVGLFSLTSAVMFIGSIKGLNKHSTAREGNYMGMVATALGILSVLLSPGFHSAHIRPSAPEATRGRQCKCSCSCCPVGVSGFFLTFLAAGGVGYGIASTVKMEDMPQLAAWQKESDSVQGSSLVATQVAGFHSFVGLAAVFAGFASYCNVANPYTVMKALETVVGIAIGSLTFTGSVVAAGKLHEMIPGKPIILPQRWLLNGGALAGSVVLTALFLNPATYASHAGAALLLGNTALWGFLGVNMVLPIGGADMPVVVSLLNAFSGLATSAAGFMLSNDLLTISGALIASSGTLLSDIMCRGINRSMYNVLLGGFGTDSSSTAAGAAPTGGRENVSEVSAVGFVGMLFGAKKVVIVPGYGLAVARCQQKLAEIVAMLRKHNVTVHFAIHPVAGRMPGHMNVLLAEADVPYDIVKEMDEINAELPTYDVGIVVGANDIVNPATQDLMPFGSGYFKSGQDDPSSPIYGMPAIEIWKCKQCVVLKRSMGTGYSGVDNPLFYLSNVKMLFGDAKQSMDNISSCLEDSQDRFTAAAGASSSGDQHDTTQGVEPEVFPEAVRVIGIVRERLPGEARVSFAPSAVVKLRRMGFSILLEAGSGTAAGFTDEEYTRHGGVQVAESSVEVLKQADIIFKVTEPLLDEVQMLQGTQMVGFWNMYGTQELLAALAQTSASVLRNLALVPRVSRAQKLDALTSMANIAGYRAILDAFGRFPRFSRAGSTAFGSVPPAKVFVIGAFAEGAGAGVAGLSAIATAHSLGCKVFANDVRDAAREQVESMGAQFIAVDAQGIAGEGAGGYATAKSQVMGEDFTRAQIATYARVIPDMDVIVTTAMIPNRAAPELITSEMVASMRKGSVIIDLAAQTGGNCVYTEPNKAVVSPNGVTVVGETNYASQMASQSSEMLGSNFTAMLEALALGVLGVAAWPRLQVLGGAENFGGEHWDDPVVKPAIVARGGAVVWDPNPPRPPAAAPTGTAVEGNGIGGFGGASPMPLPPPEEANAVIAWIQEHKDELALGVGGAVVLGLGLAVDIPEAEVTHLGYFVLSCLIGALEAKSNIWPRLKKLYSGRRDSGTAHSAHQCIWEATGAVTNAISGIIVVGGMLQLSGPVLSARVACALAAVFLSSVNIVGGFAVTARMLDMFREDANPKKALAERPAANPEEAQCALKAPLLGAPTPTGALVPLLLALAALTDKLTQVSAVADEVPDVCRCIDQAQPLRPELLALLRGNLRKLWRQPLTEESDWALQAQVRLRTLLATIFDSGLIEVSKANCLALAQSAGVRSSLDFIVLLLLAATLVHRLARPPPTPKRRKRKRRSEPEELEEEIEALTAPGEEALDALLSVDPGSMQAQAGVRFVAGRNVLSNIGSSVSSQQCPRAPIRPFPPLRHMPEYELLYWPVSGLAEPIRLSFVVAGIPFKDTTPLTDPEFNDRKLALHPYAPDAAGLPILVFDGKVCCQSRAILRCIGRLAQHEGAFLYPTEDPLEQLLCDELIDLSEDLRRPMSATVTTQYKDAAEKEAARHALLAPDGECTKFLKVLDKKFGESFPTKLTIGNIYAWSIVTMFRQPTFIPEIPADALSPYENLTKLHQWMSSLPAIKAYYESSQGRDNYKPL